MFAYKATSGSVPIDLNSIVQTYAPSWPLRSLKEFIHSPVCIAYVSSMLRSLNKNYKQTTIHPYYIYYVHNKIWRFFFKICGMTF